MWWGALNTMRWGDSFHLFGEEHDFSLPETIALLHGQAEHVYSHSHVHHTTCSRTIVVQAWLSTVGSPAVLQHASCSSAVSNTIASWLTACVPLLLLTLLPFFLLSPPAYGLYKACLLTGSVVALSVSLLARLKSMDICSCIAFTMASPLPTCFRRPWVGSASWHAYETDRQTRLLIEFTWWSLLVLAPNICVASPSSLLLFILCTATTTM